MIIIKRLKMDEKLETMKNPAVLAHIKMLQSIVCRMSNNSANCKSWTVTVVVAMLVLLADKASSMQNVNLCLVPIILFYLIDCYYLGLERLCIQSQMNFIRKVHAGDFVDGLFSITEMYSFCTQMKSTIKAFLSFSTMPFYLVIILFVLSLNALI